MKRKKSIDYLVVIKYFSLTLLCAIFSMIKGSPSVYSVGVFSAVIALNQNPFIMAIVLVLSTVIVGGKRLLFYFLSPIILFLALWGLYKAKKKQMSAELAIFTFLSLLPYVALFDAAALVEKITDSVITSVIALVLYIGGKAVTSKGLKYKLGYEEVFTVFISIALTGLGMSNLISPYLWKGLSIFLILCISFVYKSEKCTIISAVLGLSLSIYYGNVSYVSLYVILAIAVISVMPLSRFLSAILVVAVDYGVYSVFGIFGEYTLLNSLSVLLGALIFSLIPTRLLNSVKDKISLFKDKQLSRMSINRNRLMTSNRLYDLSAVFLEIADSFTALAEHEKNERAVTNSVANQILCSVCANCANKAKCVDKPNKKADLMKTVEIGLAKGKLSFIDIPCGLSGSCIHPNDLIFAANRVISNVKEKSDDKKNKEAGRILLSGGAKGVAEILKRLAFEFGAQLKYQSQMEKTLSEKLYRSGYKITELLIYGENTDQSVSMIVTGKEFSVSAIKKIVESVINTNLNLTEKCFVTDEKCYLCFKGSAKFDAVFGVCSLKKDNSAVSGDTHAVSRIQGDKFLVALSDGMGSGNDAEKVSSVSLSLIESFYKAGLSSPFVLSTVNKLLAVNTDDIFTALDVTVVDLKNCTADFIKYGAPYAFIISENSVKIVEGSSLPMGILDDLSPAVVKSELSDGDVVLMMTDGVSDAFGSSADVLEFLRTMPAKNPQTLADAIVKKALDISGGKKNDDMTALAVRIFERERDYA